MNNVEVLASPPVAAGFALAGLRTVSVETGAEGRVRMLALADDPEVTVVLVEETALKEFSAVERMELLTRDRPIVVPFAPPARLGVPAGESALILDILRRAVGYRVRLR